MEKKMSMRILQPGQVGENRTEVSYVTLSSWKKDVSTFIDFLTGHILLRRHAEMLGVSSNDFWRGYTQEEEPEVISL